MRLTVFLDASEDVIDVVGEEALSIEHRLDQTGDRTKGHILRMCVSVPLGTGSQSVLDKTRHLALLHAPRVVA